MLGRALLAASLMLAAASAQQLPMENVHYLFESVAGTYLNHPTVINGTVPTWIKGSVLKNGFGQFESKEGGFEFLFLFDVMSQIVKFTVADGQVVFSNTVLDSAYYNDSKKGIPPFRTFGPTNPDMPWWEKIIALPNVHMSDNLNVNIVKLGDIYVAISDMAGDQIVDPWTLQALGVYNWTDQVSSVFDMITSAHPSSLPGSPIVYNYKAEVLGNFPNFTDIHKYKLYSVDTSVQPLQRNVLLEIPIDRIPYMHSFALTPNYIIFLEFPLFWNIMGIATTMNPILDSLQWDPTNGTRVLVIDLHTNQVVKTMYTEAFFAYHHVNAFEDGLGNVVVDICTYPDGSHLQSFKLSTLRGANHSIPAGAFKRYTVPVKDPSDLDILVSEPAKIDFDLPAVNPNYRGQKYRYAYGTGVYMPGQWWTSLVKVDTVSGEVKTWVKPNHWPTEPVFVPTPGATAEDDGVLMSIVLGTDLNSPSSYLLLLNATDFSEIATAAAPVMVPYTSHGFFDTTLF